MLPLTVGLMNMITCLNLPGVPRGQQALECHHYIRQLKSLWSLIAEHTVSKRELSGRSCMMMEFILLSHVGLNLSHHSTQSILVCVCVPIWCVSYVCEMFVCYMCALCLHEGLQALSDVSLSQWYRPVGFWTLQGSLVLLAAHQTQHGSVQILVLLLWGQSAALTLEQVPLKKSSPHTFL